MRKKIFFILLYSVRLISVVYEFVTVGDAGNGADDTGFGAVSYLYKIGKYPITIAQYTEFLNAVASIDTHGLYTIEMLISNIAGISRSGTIGSYTYQVVINGGLSSDRPITCLSWFSTARFANWMSNGQPSGFQDVFTTENGAYPLEGAVEGDAVVKNILNPNTGSPPTHYIPSEDEWYKAAFYNPTLNSGSGGYYLYATGYNDLPGNSIGSSTNQANYFTAAGFSVSGSPDYSSSQPYLTDVGSFSGSASYYGTYDQNGNVWEWNDLDALLALPLRGARGGGYRSIGLYLQSDFRLIMLASAYNIGLGARLAGPL
jgi:hypothetical protein